MSTKDGVLPGLVMLAFGYCQPANAQTPYQNVQGSNFDIWCQEHAELPPERCDKRTPGDEKRYEAYRDKIGNYEEKLRLDQEVKARHDRTMLHNDPIDNPEGRTPLSGYRPSIGHKGRSHKFTSHARLTKAVVEHRLGIERGDYYS